MNGRRIPEADWKIWRRLSQIALERYCARILNEAAQYASGEDSAHKRYLDLFRYLAGCNRIVALVFDDLKRSTAFISIANAIDQGLLSWEEASEFSQETQLVLKAILR